MEEIYFDETLMEPGLPYIVYETNTGDYIVIRVNNEDKLMGIPDTKTAYRHFNRDYCLIQKRFNVTRPKDIYSFYNDEMEAEFDSLFNHLHRSEYDN